MLVNANFDGVDIELFRHDNIESARKDRLSGYSIYQEIGKPPYYVTKTSNHDLITANEYVFVE